MSTLVDNISSDYLGGFANLSPKSKAKLVVVYVEGDEDISFWRNILDKYETTKVKFEIFLPSRDSLTKHKQAALSRSVDLLELKGTGKFLLICVDSDYDYLLNEYYTRESKKIISKEINENIYILQTYSYSMENLKCFSKSLRCICVNATNNDKEPIDFINFLSEYSNIVYDLLLWNLYFYSVGLDNEFFISDFCPYLKINKYNDNDLSYGLNKLKQNIDIKIKELEKDHPDFIEKVQILGENLIEYGLNRDESYLFVKGHTLFDNVVLILLKFFGKKLKTEKFNKIKELARHKEEKDTNINSYINQTKNLDQQIETLLIKNNNFTDCYLFKKIEADIKKYVNQEL